MVHYGQMSQFGLICPKDSVPEVLLKYIFANLHRAAMFFCGEVAFTWQPFHTCSVFFYCLSLLYFQDF